MVNISSAETADGGVKEKKHKAHKASAKLAPAAYYNTRCYQPDSPPEEVRPARRVTGGCSKTFPHSQCSSAFSGRHAASSTHGLSPTTRKGLLGKTSYTVRIKMLKQRAPSFLWTTNCFYGTWDVILHQQCLKEDHSRRSWQLAGKKEATSGAMAQSHRCL